MHEQVKKLIKNTEMKGELSNSFYEAIIISQFQTNKNQVKTQQGRKGGRKEGKKGRRKKGRVSSVDRRLKNAQ